MFGNAILDLIGNKGAPQRLGAGPLAAPAGMPPAGGSTPVALRGVAGAAAPPQAPQAPQGQQPQAYQSPPQLMELYNQLIERQRNSSMIDAGIGLVASAFAQPQNRANILSSMMSGGGDASPEKQITAMAAIMKMQQEQAALERRAQIRQNLPAIAAKHNLDQNTAEYLFETGELDKVLSDLSKPHNQAVAFADGTQGIVDLRNGKVLSTLGPKKIENEVVTLADGRQAVVDKATGNQVNVFGPRRTPDAPSEARLWAMDNADRQKRGLGERSLSEFLSQTARDRAGASNYGPSNINYGEPPKDMAWKRNPDGSVATNPAGAPIAVPIAGSKLEEERADSAKKEGMQGAQKGRTADVVIDNIDRVLGAVSKHKNDMLPLTGASSMIGNIPMATPHRDMQANLDTIKSNIGFDKLQEMRAASPTGGALGQVSDFENKLLQSTFGSLDPTQSREQFEGNLRRVRAIYDAVVNKGIKDESEANAIIKRADVEAIPLDELLNQYGGK